MGNGKSLVKHMERDGKAQADAGTVVEVAAEEAVRRHPELAAAVVRVLRAAEPDLEAPDFVGKGPGTSGFLQGNGILFQETAVIFVRLDHKRPPGRSCVEFIIS